MGESDPAQGFHLWNHLAWKRCLRSLSPTVSEILRNLIQLRQFKGSWICDPTLDISWMFKLGDSTATYNAQHTKGYTQLWEKCLGSKGLIIAQRRRV